MPQRPPVLVLLAAALVAWPAALWGQSPGSHPRSLEDRRQTLEAYLQLVLAHAPLMCPMPVQRPAPQDAADHAARPRTRASALKPEPMPTAPSGCVNPLDSLRAQPARPATPSPPQ